MGSGEYLEWLSLAKSHINLWKSLHTYRKNARMWA
jgi:hypothetical protein